VPLQFYKPSPSIHNSWTLLIAKPQGRMLVRIFGFSPSKRREPSSLSLKAFFFVKEVLGGF